MKVMIILGISRETDEVELLGASSSKESMIDQTFNHIYSTRYKLITGREFEIDEQEIRECLKEVYG